MTARSRALLVLDDVEAHYWKRINRLKRAEDRLRLKGLLTGVLKMLQSIEEA